MKKFVDITVDIIYIAKMIMYAHISPTVPNGCIYRVCRKSIGGKEMKVKAKIETSPCPFCGSGTIGYHINSYVQIVKQCDNCKHTIADDFVTTNKNNFSEL